MNALQTEYKRQYEDIKLFNEYKCKSKTSKTYKRYTETDLYTELRDKAISLSEYYNNNHIEYCCMREQHGFF